jgi:beta-lactamase regulating signal transducer with metallopeptidase domain
VFSSSSLVELLNIYVVENVTHSLVAALVILPLVVWFVKPPAARIRYLLVPLLLPIFCPPLYYSLFPGRQELPVLPLDKLLGLGEGLSFLGQWPAFVMVFGAVLLLATLYFLVRGSIAVATTFYLPLRYPRLASGQKERIERMLAPLLARAGLSSPVILQSPSWQPLCCAFGLRRPYILLSRGLLEGWDDEHLEGVIAHELAHFLRRDQWLNLMLLALRSLFFFNPIVHLLCRAVAQEQELACDALALRLGQRRLTYAESLLKAWRQGPVVPALARPTVSGFLSQPAALRRRVLAVLDGGAEGPGHGHLLVAVTAGLLVALFFVC